MFSSALCNLALVSRAFNQTFLTFRPNFQECQFLNSFNFILKFESEVDILQKQKLLKPNQDILTSLIDIVKEYTTWRQLALIIDIDYGVKMSSFNENRDFEPIVTSLAVEFDEHFLNSLLKSRARILIVLLKSQEKIDEFLKFVEKYLILDQNFVFLTDQTLYSQISLKIFNRTNLSKIKSFFIVICGQNLLDCDDKFSKTHFHFVNFKNLTNLTQLDFLPDLFDRNFIHRENDQLLIIFSIPVAILSIFQISFLLKERKHFLNVTIIISGLLINVHILANCYRPKSITSCTIHWFMVVWGMSTLILFLFFKQTSISKIYLQKSNDFVIRIIPLRQQMAKLAKRKVVMCPLKFDKKLTALRKNVSNLCIANDVKMHHMYYNERLFFYLSLFIGFIFAFINPSITAAIFRTETHILFQFYEEKIAKNQLIIENWQLCHVDMSWNQVFCSIGFIIGTNILLICSMGRAIDVKETPIFKEQTYEYASLVRKIIFNTFFMTELNFLLRTIVRVRRTESYMPAVFMPLFPFLFSLSNFLILLCHFCKHGPKLCRNNDANIRNSDSYPETQVQLAVRSVALVVKSTVQK